MKQILLIEDNPDHSELIIRSLSQGLGRVKIHHADRIKKAFELLEQRTFDLILSDYYLPDSRGEAHITRLAKIAPETPIIIITGQGDEKTAARSIKAGADDYIVKTRAALKALPRILNRAFSKHQAQLKRKQKEIKKQLQDQQTALKKVLNEVQVIEKKMGRLQKLSNQEEGPTGTIDGLIDQINQLKSFVQKMFTSGK